jgi:hypothetical protein
MAACRAGRTSGRENKHVEFVFTTELDSTAAAAAAAAAAGKAHIV